MENNLILERELFIIFSKGAISKINVLKKKIERTDALHLQLNDLSEQTPAQDAAEHRNGCKLTVFRHNKLPNYTEEKITYLGSSLARSQQWHPAMIKAVAELQCSNRPITCEMWELIPLSTLLQTPDGALLPGLGSSFPKIRCG